ncbi:MAG: type II toxin-antitoxin system RelE/ParE family toxin [Actinomycetota bacterium]|nr:type II toxin-antitoxin system RelE/ParE family toxin [Actinomycetota bacterium]MDP9478397.1 type II toxin-antitoxin system RelE/ParE family toxin [Actinomycetota bacterium]MDP9486176.1 type II toxin-antitoxin system RelE/ParE family toxin [Actinomycetota bacterium]
MAYRVLIRRKAQRQLDKIRREDRQRIIEAVFGLADDPRPRGTRSLRGQPGYRLRVGDYRAIYEVDDEALVVTILAVGHRRDVYRRG